MFFRRTIICMVLIIVFSLAASVVCWAREETYFTGTLEGYVTKVYISPGFSQDKTAFAFVKKRSSGDYLKSYEYTVLHRSKDGGLSWEKIKWLVDNVYLNDENVLLYDIAFLPDNSLLLSGYFVDENKPFLCVSKNGGDRWETIKLREGESVRNIEAAGKNLLAVFQRENNRYNVPSLLRSSQDEGKTWNYDLNVGVFVEDGTISVLNEKTFFIVKENHSLWLTNDSGKTWRDTGLRLSEAPIPGEFEEPGRHAPTLKGKVVSLLENTGEGVVIACNPSALADVFVSRDSGTTWKKVDQKYFEWRPKYTASSVLSVTAARGGLNFAGTPDGCVLVSKDYGETWSSITKGIMDEVLDIECASSGDIVVVLAATPGGLYRMEYQSQPGAENGQDQVEEQRKDEEQKIDLDTSEALLIRFKVGQNSYSVRDRLINMDAEVFIENGRTYVPLRYLGEALDAEVRWESDTQAVLLVKDNITVKLVVGSKNIQVDGRNNQTDVAPVVKNNRTYLPARYVAEAFGYIVSWDVTTQLVTVKMNCLPMYIPFPDGHL